MPRSSSTVNAAALSGYRAPRLREGDREGARRRRPERGTSPPREPPAPPRSRACPAVSEPYVDVVAFDGEPRVRCARGHDTPDLRLRLRQPARQPAVPGRRLSVRDREPRRDAGGNRHPDRSEQHEPGAAGAGPEGPAPVPVGWWRSRSMPRRVVEHVLPERGETDLGRVAEVARRRRAPASAGRRRTGPPSCAASCSGCSRRRSWCPGVMYGLISTLPVSPPPVVGSVASKSGSSADVRAASVTPLTGARRRRAPLPLESTSVNDAGVGRARLAGTSGTYGASLTWPTNAPAGIPAPRDGAAHVGRDDRVIADRREPARRVRTRVGRGRRARDCRNRGCRCRPAAAESSARRSSSGRSTKPLKPGPG